jgi:hypothetical protein
MNKKIFLRVFLMAFVLIICLSTYFCGPENASGREDTEIAPIPIIDFEGTSPFNEFCYTNLNIDDYENRLFTNDPRYIKQGRCSHILRWNFNRNDHFFGWGVVLQHAGEAFDTRKAKSLTFWVIGTEGGERFHIKLKDINRLEVPLRSINYVEVSKEWQKVSVPLKDFGKKIDLSRLENVSLGFDQIVAGRSGCIYIDDFAFEF